MNDAEWWLQVPVAEDGRMLVAADYMQYLVRQANAKMETNWHRIDAFHDACKTAFATPEVRLDLAATTFA